MRFTLSFSSYVGITTIVFTAHLSNFSNLSNLSSLSNLSNLFQQRDRMHLDSDTGADIVHLLVRLALDGKARR